MSLDNRLFIARKYWIQDFNLKSFYDEAIFKTYELAYQFIKEISDEDNPRFLSEIVSYIIDEKESWENEQIWTFDNNGKLLKFYDSKEEEKNTIIFDDGSEEIGYEPKPENYTSKFKIGDLVLLEGYPKNINSPIPEDVIGVVAESPMPYKEWIEQGNSKYDWNDQYVIFIIRDGYLLHLHVYENDLIFYKDKVPERFNFLITFSKHITGQETIKKDIFTQVVNGEIFVENIQTFDREKHLL